MGNMTVTRFRLLIILHTIPEPVRIGRSAGLGSRISVSGKLYQANGLKSPVIKNFHSLLMQDTEQRPR